MSSALDDIEYLSSSEYRVKILDTVSASACDRHEIQEETGASRVTTLRILNQFEDREWIKRTEDEYSTTPLGDLVLEEFSSLVDSMEKAEKLREVVVILPTDDMGMDITHFSDARITFPDPENPFRQQERELELIRNAERLWVVVDRAIPQHVKTASESVKRGSLKFRGVLTSGFIDELPEKPELSAYFYDMTDSGGKTWEYDGEIPYNMLIVDDTVSLWLCTDGGTALLESDNQKVLDWGESMFESYREESKKVSANVFTN